MGWKGILVVWFLINDTTQECFLAGGSFKASMLLLYTTQNNIFVYKLSTMKFVSWVRAGVGGSDNECNKTLGCTLNLRIGKICNLIYSCVYQISTLIHFLGEILI